MSASAGLLGVLAATLAAAPSASAAPDCSPAGLSNTVSSVTGIWPATREPTPW